MRLFWSQLRITVRTLGKARGFSSAAILTLAVGIALAVIALAVVNAYLLRSLPYPAADRLYSVAYAPPGEDHPEGLADLDWASLSDAVEHPVAWDLDMFYLTGGERTEAAPGAWVTPGFMQGLGIRVARGRTFDATDYEAGATQVVLISDELWRTRFGADSGVVGRRMEAYVSDRPQDPEVFTIVGVLPADFWHLNRFTQVLTPLRAPSYPYFVRLREGIPPMVVEQRIAALVRQSGTVRTDRVSIALHSVHDGYVTRVRPLLLSVAAAVGLVLLMTCSNVALLVLLRGMRRQKEIAVRLALGAGPGSIAGVLLLETIVIATSAALTGTLAAWLALRWLAPMIEQQLGARVPGGPGALSIDAGVIAAVAALTVGIALLLSLAPIISTLRRTLFTTLRNTRSTGTGGVGARRTRYLLIGVEVAGSLALLVGSGLMVKTVVRMLDVDVGARYQGVMSAPLAIREHSYPDDSSRAAVYDRVLSALAPIEGASPVALSTPSPTGSYPPIPVQAGLGAQASPAGLRAITPGYFTTLAIPLRHGRPFTTSDGRTAVKVAIVSESAARRLWPTSNPLGQQVWLSEDQIKNDDDTTAVARTVVGVVGDVRHSPTDEEVADIYVPLTQVPGRFAVIVARPAGLTSTWTQELYRTIASVDREIAVTTPQSMELVMDREFARPRFMASLFGAFGLFASALGMVGLYAVIAYAVKQREHEIAIRMAVGAGAGSILSLFLREGLVLMLAGIVVGSLAALGVGRMLESQLFGVPAVDPATVVTAALGLSVISLCAIWAPARRATRIDPILALKEE